jgi:hypothetical protein
MGESLLLADASSMTSSSLCHKPSLLHVLRTGCPAVCLAVAHSKAWRLVLAYVTRMSQVVRMCYGSRAWTSFVHKSSSYIALNGDGVLYGSPPTAATTAATTAEITVSVTTRDFGGDDFPEDSFWRMVRYRCDNNMNFDTKDEPLASTASLFLDIFVQHASSIDRVYVAGEQEADLVIQIWFALEVDESLRLHFNPHSKSSRTLIPELASYRQHRGHICLSPYPTEYI